MLNFFYGGPKTSPQALAQLVDMLNPEEVLRETRQIIRDISPAFDFSEVEQVFRDVTALFRGQYPGFRACNTQYHDLQHTTDCFLSQARLIHGAVVQGRPLTDDAVSLGLACALMHDTGYIQTRDDTRGTGARHTLNHVSRSIEFMQAYCKGKGMFKGQMKEIADILRCTGLDTDMAALEFSSPDIEFLGKALGTSDLAGQMGDRTYLEKLIFLFEEFVEAGISGMETEYKFLCETKDFYTRTEHRLAEELGNVRQYYRPHFNAFYKIDRDLYADAMTANLAFLMEILQQDRADFIFRLRRHGLPAYLDSLKRRPAGKGDAKEFRRTER